MKFLLIAAILTTSANAGLIKDAGFAAKMTKFEIDQNSGLVADKVSLSINNGNKEASLYLNTSAGVVSVKLPIRSQTVDACGVITMIAEKNFMDGNKHSMIITDRAASTCDGVKILAATEVELQVETMSPRLVTRSYFSGFALKPISNL